MNKGQNTTSAITPKNFDIPLSPFFNSLEFDKGRLMRLPEVEYEVGMTRSTIYRKIAVGTFPAPVKIDGNMARWWESDITAWKMGIAATLIEPGIKPGTQ